MMANPFIRQLQYRHSITEEEKLVLEQVTTRIERCDTGQTIIRAGAHRSESILLIEGLACRYKAAAGCKRQITALHVPGDFVDLDSFVLKRIDHTVAALTPCKLAVASHEELLKLTECYPRLGRALWFCTLLQGASYREWVASMGHLPASARMARLVCELYIRLKIAGQTNGFSFHLPLTQTKVGEALGLSGVHVNRILQQLRADQLIVWRQETVTIPNWKRLCHAGRFDPAYLYLSRELS